MKYTKVEGQSSLVRDNRSNAILNIDKTEYQNYINLKKQKEKDLDKINKIESDLLNLKSDIDEVKYLLRSLINESR